MKLIVTLCAVGAALAAAWASTLWIIPRCGENQEPCDATSSPVLAAVLAWAGVGGVVLTFALSHIRMRRAATLTGAATAILYCLWLYFVTRDT